MRVSSGICLSVAVLVAGLLGGCERAEKPVGRLSVSPDEIILGYPASTTVNFKWQPQESLGEGVGRLEVFVHLRDASGNVIRTYDHPFPGSWEPGSVVDGSVRLFQSLLGPALLPGTYSLSAGLYGASSLRWPLETSGPSVARDEYEVATVVVPEEWDAAPDFDFGAGWSSVESGTDLQILGRRHLGRRGRLEIGGLQSAGTLWLDLRIPKVRPGVQSLNLDEGASEPQVTLTGTCNDLGACCAGVGRHLVALPIAQLEDGSLPESCFVEVETNYTVVDEASGLKTSVFLDSLSWDPAGPGVSRLEP